MTKDVGTTNFWSFFWRSRIGRFQIYKYANLKMPYARPALRIRYGHHFAIFAI